MNADLDNDDRRPGEFIAFGLVHLGLLIAVVGVVLAAAHLALTGLVVAGLGFLPFALKRD